MEPVLVLLLLPLAAVSAVVQRSGKDVTLSCGNVLDGQRGCNATTWNYIPGGETVELVGLGRIKEHDKADRLRVLEDKDCSLLIKNVSVQDAGRFDCVQYRSDGSENHIEVHRSAVDLSVVSLTEDEDDDEVKLKCSVTPSGRDCRQEVKLKLKGQGVKDNDKDISGDKCSLTWTFKKSHYLYQRYHLIKCSVTENGTEKMFPFRPGPSGDTQSATEAEPWTTPPGTRGASGNPPVPWWLIAVGAAGLIGVLIVAVVLVRWRRTRGNRPTDGNAADADDGVSYATISFSRKAGAKVRAEGGGDMVTYSSVRAPPSPSSPPPPPHPPAGASADPSCLYATVNFN